MDDYKAYAKICAGARLAAMQMTDALVKENDPSKAKSLRVLVAEMNEAIELVERRLKLMSPNDIVTFERAEAVAQGGPVAAAALHEIARDVVERGAEDATCSIWRLVGSEDDRGAGPGLFMLVTHGFDDEDDEIVPDIFPSFAAAALEARTRSLRVVDEAEAAAAE